MIKIFAYSTFLVTSLISANIWAADTGNKKPAAKSAPAIKASTALDIVAVAGEEAISSFDVDARSKFVIVTSNLSNSEEVRKNIRPQIIRSLIDEALQRNFAKEKNITVEQSDIEKAIATIEQQRGMQPGSIAAMMQANNIPAKTFTDQIRSQLMWNKWLGKNILPQIKISDEEIALAKSRIAKQPNISEMEISLIALPVSKKQKEAEVKKTADNLVSELQKGAKFEELARQFSQGDGKSFWVRPEQLDPNIAAILKTKKEGDITPPIRTADGFSIIKIFHVRSAASKLSDQEITLKEIIMKLKQDAPSKEADALLKIAEEVAKHAGTCEEKGIAGISNLDDMNIEVNFRTSPASDLPPAIRSLSETMKVGAISTPLASDDGIRLYMLCGKKEIEGSGVSSANIREALLHQRFALEAEKQMRILRRDSFIEIRE